MLYSMALHAFTFLWPSWQVWDWRVPRLTPRLKRQLDDSDADIPDGSSIEQLELEIPSQVKTAGSKVDGNCTDFHSHHTHCIDRDEQYPSWKLDQRGSCLNRGDRKMPMTRFCILGCTLGHSV